MKTTFGRLASLLSVSLLAVASSLTAQGPLAKPANRIAANADLGPVTRLAGNLPRWVTPSADAGAAPDETPLHITLVLSRSAAQEDAFTQLLVDQQNPSSLRYHQWLTPAQIGEQFGPSMDDVSAVTGWLARQGLKVVSVAPSRLFVEVSGTTGTIGAALSTSFHRYRLEGQMRLAAATEPTLPSALTVAVSGIDGLAEIPLRPFHTSMVAEPRAADDILRPMGSNSTNTIHYIYPGDFAKIYDVTTISGGVYAGTGVKVAIIGRSQIAASDITLLENIAGLPAKTQNTIIVPGTTDPGFVTTTGDQDESTLDVGRVLTVAPGSQADLVIASQATGGISAAMQYNIQTLIDPVMTISYGACESLAGTVNINFIDTLFKQGAAEGISTFVSSGDSSAAGCTASGATPKGTEVLGINYLCSSSYVTCVGGTQFNDTASPATYWSPTNSATFTSALGYIPEGAWNEPSYQKTTNGVTSTAYQILGTGGGPSLVIPKPTWQTGTGVPADGFRDTPDISFTSAGHDPYFSCLAYKGSAYDCATGGGTLFYGTSAASPDMAAVAAILVQRMGKAQGNLNPILYPLAASIPAAFHDATPASSGVGSACTVTVASMCNNSLPSSSGLSGLNGYPLQVGYDLSTGLGSLDVTNFINAVAGGAVLLGSTTTISAQPATILVGKTAVFTATVVGGGSAAVSGTVQFSSNGTALGAPVTLSGGTASTPSTTFTAPGTYTITATYSGNTAYAGSTATALSFVVTLPSTTTTLTGAPTTILAGRTAVFTANVAITSGTAATGTVQFASNGSNLGAAVPLSGGVATTPTTSFPTAGNYTITATYSGDSANATSTGTLSFVVSPLPATITTVTALPLTITAGGSSVFTANLAGTGAATATGTVLFLNGTTPIGGPVALSGGKASTSAQTFTAAGTYTIGASYSGDSNNAASSGSLSFVVTAATPVGLAVSATPATLTLTAGATSGNTSNLAVTTTAPYFGSVALGCTVNYTGGTAATFPPTCSFTPASITYAGTSTGSSVLTLTTTLPRATPGTGQAARNKTLFAPLGGIGLAALLLLIPTSRRRKIRPLAILPLILLGAGLMAISGCGSSASTVAAPTPVGTSKGAYTIFVSATPSAGTLASTTVNLTVQ